MQTQLINENNNISEGIHILLDTCVFINAFHYQDKFIKLFQLLKERKCILTTTKLNYLEFTRGFDTLQKFNDARNFVEDIVDFIYPLREIETGDYVDSIKFAYRKDGGKLSTTDFLLGALAMRFGKEMQILSKDHGDFTGKLFDIKSYIPFRISNTSVEIYCLYQFSNDKYAIALKSLGRTANKT